MMKDRRGMKIAAKVMALGSIIKWYPLVIRTPPGLPWTLVVIMMMTMVRSSRKCCSQAKWNREIKHEEHRQHKIFWPIKLQTANLHHLSRKISGLLFQMLA